MTYNTDHEQKAVDCIKHMNKINELRAEWLAEYGIDCDLPTAGDELQQKEEELVPRTRKSRVPGHRFG